MDLGTSLRLQGYSPWVRGRATSARGGLGSRRAGRAARIPRDGERAPAEPLTVEGREPPGERRRASGDDRESLARGGEADRSDGGAEHAGLLAGGEVVLGRELDEKAAEAGRLARQDRHE